MSTEKYPWPHWQLTAFVLDELKPEIAAQIQSAADNDPSLAAEITAIRATVAQVTRLYQHETAGIEPTTFAPVAAGDQVGPLTVSSNDPVVYSRATDVKVNWTAAVGLLVVAASLLIAVVFAAPALRTYLAQSNDVLANADHAQRVTVAEAKTRERTKKLQEAKAELSSTPAVRRSSVAAEQLSDEPQSFTVHVPPADSPLAANTSNLNTVLSESVIEAESESSKPLPNFPLESLRQHNEQAKSSDSEVAMDEQGASKSLEASKDIAPNVDGDQDGAVGIAANSLEGLEYIPDVRSQKSLGKKSSGDQKSSGVPNAGDMGSMGGKEAKASSRNAGGRSGKSAGGGMGAGGMGGMGMGGMNVGGRGGMKGDSSVPRDQGKADGSGLSNDLYAAQGMADHLAAESPAEATSSPYYLQDDVQYFPAGEYASENEALRARGRRLSVARETSSDRYAPIYETPFKFVESDPLTTFSIDVDTASYVKTRQFLMQSRTLPPANAVRVEEFINYFEYEYAGPHGEDPFAANLAVATCPWRSDHKLVRIALQAKKMDVSERPKANIVFLLDVSGSMDEPNKLPLVKESMRMLIHQLGENDRVAMVVYAGAAGCVLESTRGDKQDVILGALDRLSAGGSTNGGQGIQLAYEIARDHFVPGGVNRVILCTDGDFNVGTTSTEGLVNLVVENAKSKVFLTVLGYGMGNTNDAMMEQISNKGNGVYGFVDSRREAQRQMIKQLAGNLMTVAKDVKIQVEFNPERVASYRLIGYENRKLENQDFANDKKDAGEIGAGHRVTALYELEPIGAAKVQPAEGLRYQKRKSKVAAEQTAKPNDETNHELLTVSLRYKQPEGDTSKLLAFPLMDTNKPFAEVDQDFKWAASVAQFAMLLRNSAHKGSASWSGLIETAESLATDESRRECVNMIRAAAGLSGR